MINKIAWNDCIFNVSERMNKTIQTYFIILYKFVRKICLNLKLSKIPQFRIFNSIAEKKNMQ